MINPSTISLIIIHNTSNWMLTSTSKYITIASILYLVAFFAFASGLVNSIIEGGRSKGIIIPSRSVQTIGETTVIVVILFMGMFGAYLLYSSGKAASSKSQWSFLIGGFTVLIIALTVGFSIIKIKMGG
ncbi:MAG TPA: hypothetical protein VFB48_03915 [Nitrososphaeraceae archaeon]|jgi:hypothetical protein|nr:hypothetical protein [Nitrososphaeraceae archaeon]